ncbi:portal protein [Microbacterium phage RikSengupta]|nr:portal protein [Microbacterium phage RikSengupta]
MADTLLQTPYATAMPYVVSVSATGWADDYDRQRMQSYDLYDDMFFNDPSQFRLMLRGSNEKPILVPTAKKIINSLGRYVGKGWGYTCTASVADEASGTEASTPEQLATAMMAFGSLFARERLLSTFRAGVPEWLRRGDWLWYVSADPLKKAGSRISVRPIDPRRYFPINGDTTDLTRVTGQQIIEETVLADGKTVALLVQTWLKASDPAHPNYGAVEPEEGFPITHQVQAYDLADYLDPLKRKPLAHVENVPQAIIPGITQLPIYHIKNNETTDDPFGRSELSGLESLISGINQSISDEDLSLALMGLGMYWTDSGAPVDETTGQQAAWKLGPNRVIEVDEDSTFNKVVGIDSVDPFQDHVDFLGNEAASTVGLSDVSIGTADNINAESGIALAIKFSPTLDTVRGKNDAINSVLTQMLHDLKQWFDIFEGWDCGSVEVASVTEDGDLLPFDREARWKELMEGVAAGIFTKAYAVGVLEQDFGYVFESSYLSDLEAAEEKAAAALDPFAARAGREAAATDSDETDPEAAESAT